MSNIDETFYLMSSPKNAARLLESIADYEKGLGKERKLIEDQNSESEKLDSLTEQDYRNHFRLKAKTNKTLLAKKRQHF